MPPVNPISLPTPMFRRTTPPRKGAKPETVAPSRVQYTDGGGAHGRGHHIERGRGLVPEIHPEKNPKAMAAIRVAPQRRGSAQQKDARRRSEERNGDQPESGCVRAAITPIREAAAHSNPSAVPSGRIDTGLEPARARPR